MAYTRVNWEDLPSTNTPINKTNLNKMDKGIYDATYENGLNVSNEVDEDYRVNVLKSKNLFGTAWENGDLGSNGVPSASSQYTRTADYLVVKPSTQYTLKISASNTQIVVYYYSNGTFLNREYVQNSDTYTFTTPSNCYRVKFRLSGQGISYTNTMLNKGSTSLPYEAFIQNQIVVDNEKYTDTLNVGSVVDSRSRVNILKGDELYNSSNVEIGKTWQGNANNNRARLVLPISPNETYNIRVKGSGVVIASIETTGTPTSSSTSNATYDVEINTQLTAKAKSTTTYLTLQLDAGTTFTTAILNSLEISIYYGTGSIVVDNEEIYSKDNIDIVDITKQITLKSGYTIANGGVYKQGKHVFGMINIGGSFSSGVQVSQVMTLPVSPSTNYISGGFITNSDQWGVPSGIAYVYINTGGNMNITTSSNATYVRVHFDIVVS